MGPRDKVLGQLVAMSRQLGWPAHDYVILGDGNTSARIDKTTFWIKASGAQLHNIPRSAFVQVAFAPVLEMLKAKELSDAEIKRCLSEAKVNPQHPHPSIETLFHALALTLECVRKPSPGVSLGRAQAVWYGSGTTFFEFAYTL